MQEKEGRWVIETQTEPRRETQIEPSRLIQPSSVERKERHEWLRLLTEPKKCTKNEPWPSPCPSGSPSPWCHWPSRSPPQSRRMPGKNSHSAPVTSHLPRPLLICHRAIAFVLQLEPVSGLPLHEPTCLQQSQYWRPKRRHEWPRPKFSSCQEHTTATTGNLGRTAKFI